MQVIEYQELKDYYEYITLEIDLHNIFASQASQVMLKGGMRFDEVGGPGWTHDGENLRLLPRKGNDARIFGYADLPTFFSNPIYAGEEYNRAISYTTYINAFRNTRPYEIFVGKKELIAHGYRHLYARTLIQEGQTFEQARQKMGEKTMASAIIYLSGTIYRM